MKPYKEIEMKLNRDRFEIFAKEQGYKDGVELFETLGYSADEQVKDMEMIPFFEILYVLNYENHT